MPISITDTKNIETFRKMINRELIAYAPGYGPELPPVEQVVDGKIFYDTNTRIGYQKRDGIWEAL